MSRFRGKYEYSIDDKGRVNIPAKFRKTINPQADETFVVVRAPNSCLRAYAGDAWEAYEKELDAMTQTADTVRMRRQLYDSLSDSQLDAQGRISLSPGQMQLAGIEKKVMLVGQWAYIELWDPQRYATFIGAGDDFDQVFYQSVKDSAR
jgi:MraZ protein